MGFDSLLAGIKDMAAGKKPALHGRQGVAEAIGLKAENGNVP